MLSTSEKALLVATKENTDQILDNQELIIMLLRDRPMSASLEDSWRRLKLNVLRVDRKVAD